MRYSDIVMDHFLNPSNTGCLTDADGLGIIGSEECGDQLRVWIKVRNGKLVAVKQQVFGCPAAIAACSMMTQLATGLTLAEAMKLTDDDIANALGGLPLQKYHCSNVAALALHEAIRNYQTAKEHKTDMVTITLLVNDVMPAPPASEHGLSFWVEAAGKHILFDTGQSNVLVQNAKRLDIDLSKTDAIVLSHGHYDHTGGLEHVLQLAPNALIYLHPAAPRVRYSCPTGKASKDISMPPAACQAIAERGSVGRVIYTPQPETVFPGITVTGNIPRLTDYEDTGGPFFLDKESQTPDRLEDDQALMISTAKGLVVILGCAHAGIINTLDYITTLSRKPIYAVMGGTHLRGASKDRMEKTFEALKKYTIQQIAPCHCTGDDAAAAFKTRLPNAFLDVQSDIRIMI